MFASCSLDGYLKIFNYDDVQLPLIEFSLTPKKLNKIFWDEAGKYLYVSREGCNPSGNLFSFFSANKDKSGELELSSQQIVRLLEKSSYEGELLEESIMNVSQSPYCQQIYFSDSQGNVFEHDVENLRKKSVKNKNDGKVKFDLFSKIYFNDNVYNFHSYDKKFYARNKMIKKGTLKNDSKSILGLALNPNDIRGLQNHDNGMKLETILAQGDLNGFLRIHKIYNYF